MTDLSVKF